jgi:hypothetical protein
MSAMLGNQVLTVALLLIGIWAPSESIQARSLVSMASGGTDGKVSPYQFVKPVRIHKQASSKTATVATLSYQLTCGENVRGLVLKESRASLALGIIVDRTDKICSSLPPAVTRKIALKSRRHLRSLVAEVGKRVVLGSVADVQISERELAVTWQDTCRSTVGIVLANDLDASKAFAAPVSAVQIAQIFDGGSQSPGRCERRMRRASLRSLDLTEHRFDYQFKLTSKPGRLSDVYLKRIVAPAKLSFDRDGRLQVLWRRSCFEKPVGLLFSGAQGNEVGVLSMVSPNAFCPNKLESQVLTSYQLEGLLLPTAIRLGLKPMSRDKSVTMTRGFTEGLDFLPISNLQLRRQGSGDHLLATALGSCGEASGIVIGQDVYGNLSAVLLANHPYSICGVNKKTNKLQVRAPLVASASGPTPQMFSLQIFGTAVN